MPQSTGLIFKKKTPAKVRVTVEEEDPAPAAPEKAGGEGGQARTG